MAEPQHEPRVLVWGSGIVGATVLVLAIPLHLTVSWPVVLVAVLGASLVAVASRLPRRYTALIISTVALVGVVSMGTDSYVQFGTAEFWGPPAAIHDCGLTFRPADLATSLGDGDGPVYRHLWTTPAGASVYGVSGCNGSGDPYIVASDGKLIVYRIAH